MKIRQLGHVARSGGVDSVCSTATDRFAAIVAWRGTRTVVGLRLSGPRLVLEHLWSRELARGAPHTWAGQSVALDVSSLVLTEDTRLYAIGGADRLLLDLHDGALLARSTAPVSPTAQVTLLGDVLVVPEGQAVSSYDAATLASVDRKQTPDARWAFAPVALGLAVLEEEAAGQSCIWRLHSGECWALPHVAHVRAEVLVFDSLAIIASGLGAPDRLTCFDARAGAVCWTHELAQPSLSVPAQAPLPFAKPMVAAGSQVIVATALQTLEARLASSGDLVWRVPLTASPTALCLMDECAWVGCADGSVTAVHVERGEAVTRAVLPGSGHAAVAIFRLRVRSGEATIVLVTRTGNIYRLELSPNEAGAVG
jgi:outer membrane protein assembly factor BamB